MLSLNSVKMNEEALVATEANIIWTGATTLPMPAIAPDTLVAYAFGEFNSIQELDNISNALIAHLMEQGLDVEAAEDIVIDLSVRGAKERAALRIKAQQQLRK